MLIEKSFAIKCPNCAYHLVGTKKVQQVLAGPGILERFLTSPKNIAAIRSSFTGLYPLDRSADGIQAYKDALADPGKYVLKPQREGGGNNFYGDDISTQLQKLSLNERNAYILMDLIRPPQFKNAMLREGKVIVTDVVSELGIYGLWVSEDSVVYLNKAAGHLLRTKRLME
jgi:glutathione synthase